LRITNNLIKPNYDKAFIIAFKAIKMFGIKELPINLLEIIKKIPVLRICPYSKLLNDYNCSLDELIEFLESDLGAYAIDRPKHQYMIYYNDTKENVGLDRFTVAHELGHHLLGHEKLITDNILLRNGFSIKEYNALEKEANAFARNLLSPAPIVKILGIEKPKEIAEIFGLGITASKARISFFPWDESKITDSILAFFSETFENTINDLKNKRVCLNCSNVLLVPKTPYCPICGSSQLIRQYQLPKDSWGETRIYNKKYQLDENSRSIICPRCHNDQLHYKGNFCPICGAYLVNKCTDLVLKYDKFGKPIEVKKGCNQLAEGNARYCIYCGNPTTFSESGFLSPWGIARKATGTYGILDVSQEEAAATLEKNNQ